MEYIEIGFLGKTHGLKGELKLNIEETFIDDFEEVETLFVQIKGHYTPFFIESVRAPESPIIKFEDIDTKEAAVPLQHKKIYLKADEVTAIIEDEVLKYADYVGFDIVDLTDGRIGVIEAVEPFPQQEMAIISFQNKEIFIPLNEILIKNIDEEKKIITMDLPEGLLNM